MFPLGISCSPSGEKEQDEQNFATQNLAKTTIPIEGMTCNACVTAVKRKFKSMDGLEKVEVSLEHREATFTYESDKITARQIQNAINEIGYKAGEPITEENRQ